MRPTLRGARLCSTQDVILICWAVARNVIPLITRRLDNDERKQLRSGDIFVWEERVDPEGLGPGIERWTDGMKWGPSRVKNEFLFYHQKTSERREERRLSVDDHHGSSAPSPPEVYGYEADPEHCLVKQSYSVKLKLPETKNEEKKWHITAYFTPATVEFLRPVSTFPEIGNADVPSGWIEAARGHKQLKLEPPSAISSAIPISREPHASSSSSSSSLSPPEGSHHSDPRLYRPSTVGHHYTDGSHTAATYSPPSRSSHSVLLSTSPPTNTGIASSSSSSSSSTIAAPTRHPRLPEYVHMQRHNGSGSSSSSSSHQHHDDDPMTGSRLQSPPPASRPMHEHRRTHHSSSSPYARVRQSPPELSFRRMHLDGADDEATKTASHHHHHHHQQQQQQPSHHQHHHQSYHHHHQQQQHKSPSSFHDNLSLPPSSSNILSTSPTSTAAAAMMMIGAAASRKSDRDLVPLNKLRGNQVPPRDPADQLQLRMLPLSRILG